MTIDIKDVKCGYNGKPVIDGFSASISSGEILCLLGPNGVGKTTLFKCILGVLPLMSGSMTVDGRELRDLSIAEYAKIIAYVPQSHSPPFSYNVLDVVTMGRTTHLSAFSEPGREDIRIAAESMERLDIGHLAERSYTELSGGERQMVLIARALAQQTVFLMMDEPTSNLDFGNQARVLKNVRFLAGQGLGIIMTTHQPDHVFQCQANVSLIMKDNELLFGSADQIITEENLCKAYGIDVAVLSAKYRQHDLWLCQPIIDNSPAKEQ